MDIVNSIINMETEKINKLINKPTLLVLYSLPQELQDKLSELELLEKKINLGSNLIDKVDCQVLIEKLKKEKKGFEKERKKLKTLIEKLKYINGSINDFNFFFIFIKKLHQLAIEKVNFEDNNKNISSKLVYKLQAEEEKLYNEFVVRDCFNKGLEILSFQPYQCYFQKFAENFFDKIQNFSDPYVNLLLMLKEVLYKSSFFCEDKIGSFNLTNTKRFLSRNIPHHVALPSKNYELIALRCFFFYEILKECIKLRPIENHLGDLKKSIILELNILSYNSYNREVLIMGMFDIQEALHKLERKYTDSLSIKSEDNESDINNTLVFFKQITEEIQVINSKIKNLFNDKYINLKKMHHLLAIISNEDHLSKLLEIFYIKIGNDFLLNGVERKKIIQTNKEALHHLFHAICRDSFYKPLNAATNLFIDKLIEDYPKNDVSILESIELEDLIEFSFYYIFTLIYTDFNSYLNAVNTKIFYTQFIIFNRYINIKLDSLEILEIRKNEKINTFMERAFKDIEEYYQLKKIILDEIKLNLEIIQNIECLLTDASSLKTDLTSRLGSNSVPMPDKDLISLLLTKLKSMQKICDSDYQKIEKHKFINKSESEKITTIETNSAIKEKIESNKLIDLISESLICLSENLTGILKHIGKSTLVINDHHKKISSAMCQIATYINDWNIDVAESLESLSLPELLKSVNEIVVENILIKQKNYKKKLTRFQSLFNNAYLSLEYLVDLINIIINKYHCYNKEMQKTLTSLSAYSIEDHNASNFFSKPIAKKMNQNAKMLNEYIKLKKKSDWLNTLIETVKLSADPQVVKLYAVIVEADDYLKTYEILSEKINFSTKKSSKKNHKSKESVSSVKRKNPDEFDNEVILSSSSLLLLNTEITMQKVKEIKEDTNSINLEKEPLLFSNDLICNQEISDVKKELTKENVTIEDPSKFFSNNSNFDITLLQDFETWNLEIENWKNDKHIQLYKLFNIIENCSRAVLINTGNAFLKYLSLHQNDLIEKNDECKKRKDQIISLFNDPAKIKFFTDYLLQYLKWFDEIFERINVCRILILQNEHNSEIKVSPRLPSSFADNRAEFNNLLTFYLRATDKYNKSQDNLVKEENKLNNLNRKFIKQILALGSLESLADDKVLSDFNIQLSIVNQLKLIIEQEFETKQKIKKKLSLLASPEIIKFYLRRIDPCDADSLIATEKYTFPFQSVGIESYVAPTTLQECKTWETPCAFYYLPSPVVYSSEVTQSNCQIFNSI